MNPISSTLGSTLPPPGQISPGKPPPSALATNSPAAPEELRDAFGDFVGNTFFSQLISSMRKTVDKPAYFHGGRGEEVFQGQLDQMLAERLSDATKEQFAEPMFDLFMLGRAS